MEVGEKGFNSQNANKNNNVKVAERENGRTKRIIKSLIAVIFLLGLGLCVSVAYNFLGGFYYCRVISFDKMLGEKQTIAILGEGAYSCACNFSGSLVVGGDINQPIEIEVANVEEPLYLRAKFAINGLDYDVGYMFGYANWIQGVDGYLYLNQQVDPFDKLGLCKTLKVNAQMELKSSTNYVIIFTVESSGQAWEYDVM